jgi:alkaline phosphatase
MISDGQPEQSGQLYTAECAKNVILMISDGQGYNTIKATDYFNGSAAMYESFPVQFGVSTYSAGLPGAPPPPAMIPYWHGASRNI